MMDKTNSAIQAFSQPARGSQIGNPGNSVSRKNKGLEEPEFDSAMLQAMAGEAPKVDSRPLAGKAELAPAASAERSPLTQKSAASLNTGAAIAGLKPWSREWVFAGGNELDPEMKPLFQSPMDALAQQPDLQAALQGMPQAQAGGLPQAGTTEAKAPVATDREMQTVQNAIAHLMKTRGEAAEALAGNAGAQQRATQPESELKAGRDSEMMSGLSLAGLGLSEQAVTELRVDAKPQGLADVKPRQVPALRSGLSGGEYLETLSAVRGGRETRSQQDGGKEHGGGLLEGRARSTKPELKILDGGRETSFDRALQASSIAVPAGIETSHLGISRPQAAVIPEVTGQVVPGAMAQDRLSTDSVLGVSQNIQGLAQGGGGEMRVRLRPDHLGELSVRVTTQGGNVGLHFQASSERSKKILESSMNHLKETLATQNLNLGRVDVTVAPQANGNMADQRQQDPGQNFSGFSGSMDTNAGGNQRQSGFGQGEQSGGGRIFDAEEPAFRPSIARARPVSDGRLDVMA